MRGANKASLAELYNKILKARIYRYLTFRKGEPKPNCYIDKLPSFVKGLNACYLGTIGTSPDKVTIEKQPEIFRRKYDAELYFEHTSDGLKTGAYVRVKLTKQAFGKSFVKQFTDEIFKILMKRKFYRNIIYGLETLEGEPVMGKFYGEQLSPVIIPKQ